MTGLICKAPTEIFFEGRPPQGKVEFPKLGRSNGIRFLSLKKLGVNGQKGAYGFLGGGGKQRMGCPSR